MAIDPNIKKKADDIRNKIYGKEVRESLANGLEEMSSDVVENEGRQSVVEGRQDSVETQWQGVSDEMTDKDVISAPEIIAARNGEANLKTRIDKDHQEVTTQLAQTNNKILVRGVDIKWFGAKGDGVTDDTEATQEWLNYCVDNDLTAFVSKGIYIISSTISQYRMKVNFEMFGQGIKKSVFKYSDNIMQNGGEIQRMFNFRNDDGYQVDVKIKDLSFDNNARNNPLPDNADSYLWQQHHSISFHPRDKKGFNVYAENLHFNDPIADGLNFSGGSNENFGVINCSNITSENRKRTRGDICVTASFDTLIINNVILDHFLVETNNVDSSLKHNVFINNIEINQQFTLYNKFGEDIDNQALISNLKVNRGSFFIGDIKTKIINSSFNTSQVSRVINNKVEFVACDFYALENFKPSSYGLVYSLLDTGSDLIFDNCEFDAHSSLSQTILPQFVSTDGHNVNDIGGVFNNCRFNNENIRPIRIRNGQYSFKGNEFNFKGVSIVQSSLTGQTDNQLIFKSNSVLNEEGFLYEPPISLTEDFPINMWFDGNNSKKPEQIINFSRTDMVGLPRDNGRYQYWFIHSLDSFELSDVPSNGSYIKGQVVKNINPDVGEYSEWICVKSGKDSGAIWKGVGKIEA